MSTLLMQISQVETKEILQLPNQEKMSHEWVCKANSLNGLLLSLYAKPKHSLLTMCLFEVGAYILQYHCK
jgi:hypothetical protein